MLALRLEMGTAQEGRIPETLPRLLLDKLEQTGGETFAQEIITMSATKDGGPAFPETRWDDATRQEVQWTGLTKRELFAAMAMQGIITRPEHVGMDLPTKASLSVEFADALLAELEKSK